MLHKLIFFCVGNVSGVFLRAQGLFIFFRTGFSGRRGNQARLRARWPAAARRAARGLLWPSGRGTLKGPPGRLAAGGGGYRPWPPRQRHLRRRGGGGLTSSSGARDRRGMWLTPARGPCLHDRQVPGAGRRSECPLRPGPPPRGRPTTPPHPSMFPIDSPPL